MTSGIVRRRWAVGLLGVGLALTLSMTTRGEDLPIGRMVGGRVANFTLDDARTGKPVSLYGFYGKKAVVLAFLGTDCPVGNLYMPRLVELAKSYGDRGVAVVAINANAHDTAEQVARHAEEFGAGFPVLKDAGNRVADLLQVERTCEVLLIDGRAKLRYRGAIDDQYGVGTRRDAPTKEYLVEALEAVLAGRDVETTATSVVGCLLDRVVAKPRAASAPRIRPAPAEIVAAREASEPEVEVGPVTYAADVAPILQNRCQECHRPGEVGPFALLSYDDARGHAAMISEVVEDRRMPPWHADPRVGGPWGNDRSLSARERSTLLAWVEQGTPLGDVKDLPAPRAFPEGWTIGTPDLVFELPEPYTVKADGAVPYVYFRVPTNLKEDTWVRAAEARPGDRSVVHHIIVYVDDHKAEGERNRGPGAHLCGYAPGDLPSVYDEGTAKLIPAGSDLIFQVHYTPTGKITVDRSSVGLILATTPTTQRAFTRGIANPRFEIPAGDDNYRVDSAFTFRKDARLLSFMPHMHLRGKDFKYTAFYPDGTREELLSVPAYDFGWQSYYRLAEPKAMPQGTRIECVAHFDNSAKNPYNPDPTRPVRWGDQTWEEMMIGYIDYVEDASAGPSPPRAAAEGGSSTGTGAVLRALLRNRAIRPAR